MLRKTQLLQPRTNHVHLPMLHQGKARQTWGSRWKDQYQRRAGIEGTISQGTRAFGLRRSRYIGQEKTICNMF